MTCGCRPPPWWGCSSWIHTCATLPGTSLPRWCGGPRCRAAGAVFVWACVGAFLATRALRNGGWSGVAAAAATSFAVLIPWLVWSATSLGGLVQVSGYALSEPPRREFLATHGDAFA